MEEGTIKPAAMITHIGGLNSVVETTLNLPHIPGGKKLIYTNIELNLTAIDDFDVLGETNSLFKDLSALVKENNGLWSADAERYLLANAKGI
ncbi:MAG: L-sorbose 1-phosphate reductase, partial [Firmicutes bacterium]|nr:L-sorbose 1-phosphate reductase [Bacillota bacterium]